MRPNERIDLRLIASHSSFELRETGLAYTIGNEAEAAYRRGDAVEKCRGDDDAWAGYCDLLPKSLADRAKRSLNQLVGGKWDGAVRDCFRFMRVRMVYCSPSPFMRALSRARRAPLSLTTLSAVFGATMSATWASHASSARRFSASLSYRS